MFDFAVVRAVDGKRSAGVDELCVRLSEALCGAPVVELLRVDGAGGDGGVDAIASTSDGREVGIQSKYFVGSLGPSLWKQVEKSVRQALTEAPNPGGQLSLRMHDVINAGPGGWLNYKHDHPRRTRRDAWCGSM